MKVQDISELSDFKVIQLFLLTLWAKYIPNIGYIKGPTIKISGTILEIEAKLHITKRSFISELPSIVQAYIQQKVCIYTIKDNFQYQSVESTQENGPQSVEKRDLYINLNDDVSKSFSYYGVIVPSKVAITELCDITITVKYLNDGSIKVENVKCQLSETTQKNEITLTILTYIFCGISVISLGILICCFRKNKLYIDVPSSNLENIAVSMLAANLLFLCGVGATKLHKVCYVVSIALHYAWLASFSFTSLAVIYIVSMLMKLRARQIINKDVQVKQRLFFTVVGLLIPILFVGPAIITDQYGPEYLSPGYGKSVCFPTQFPGNLIFFSGPVMASILINLFCLITVMIKLHVATMAANQIRHTSTYRQGKVYLRLIAVSGVFWITGILAVLLRSEWLEYAFTFLCGLHGFFLSLANLTTLRVSRPGNNRTDTN